jgi:hypothetical protein
MRILIAISTILISACSVTPKIIQDERVPCKNEPNVQVNTGSNLGWILWYVTMAGVVVYWWVKENKKEEIENE